MRSLGIHSLQGKSEATYYWNNHRKSILKYLGEIGLLAAPHFRASIAYSSDQTTDRVTNNFRVLSGTTFSPYAVIGMLIDMAGGIRHKSLTDVDKCNIQGFLLRLMDIICSDDVAVRVNLDCTARLVGRYCIGANPAPCVYCCISVVAV